MIRMYDDGSSEGEIAKFKDPAELKSSHEKTILTEAFTRALESKEKIAA